MTFGEYVKMNRQTLGYSLREWCRTFGYDPSNWSKMERGRIRPPMDDAELALIGDRLRLETSSARRRTFYDLAMIARGVIPADVLADDEVVRCLPVFIRCCRGERMTDEEIGRLIALIRQHG